MKILQNYLYQHGSFLNRVNIPTHSLASIIFAQVGVQ